MLTNADWYLMRSTGVVALVLLTIVVVLGILTANRVRLGGQPRFVTAAVHRSTSLLSVVFLTIHVVTAVVDPYAAVSLLAVIVPGARAASTFWITLGALSLDLIIALIATSLLRARLGYRTWKATHWLAYLSLPLAFAHSIGMGSDATSVWFRLVALACLAAVLAATASRVRLHRPGKRLEPQVIA
jgi:methionine sulfoxide reductase heme-binding subunit